jgi:hypothetical protein
MAESKIEAAAAVPIRHGMDVYSAYQDHYLGTVVGVWHSAVVEPDPADRGATPEQTQSVGHSAEGGSTLQVEEDHSQHTHEATASRTLGEDLGPFPTRRAGNTGPTHQAAGQHYATTPRHTQRGVVYFAVRTIRPGSLLNLVAPRLYIPTTAILSISMERIVLNVQPEQFPQEWGRRPPA